MPKNRRIQGRRMVLWLVFVGVLVLWGWWSLTGLLIFVGVLGVFEIVWMVSTWVGRCRLGEALQAPRVDRIALEGGWSLAVARHPAEGPRRAVVVTCHGFNANRGNMDLSSGSSLVEFFCQHGFEVWNVDLRGYGESRARSVAEGGPSDPLWSFDDHASRDVPAILAHITEESEVDAVHWVGHSMGGLVMYAYLGLHPEETRVASLCCLGSPAGLPPSLSNRLIAWVAPLIFAVCAVFPLRWLARGGAMLIPYLPIHLGFSYPPNIEPYVFRRGLFVMTEDFNERITAVFLEMLRSGRFLSADGKIDYLAELAKVQVPLCCIAGEGDTLAPPAQVRLGYEKIGSSCKEFHVMGRSFGARLDYCHNGLIFAKHAHEEVYPLILRWLEARCA